MTNAIHRTTEAHIRFSNATPVQQRVCLSCNWWMRSSSPAHRICNYCKHCVGGGTAGRVGSRIRPVEGIARTEAWQWNTEKIDDEYSNVLNLEGGV